MAPNGAMCYYTSILTKRRNMDYENDYNLLEDLAEQELWQDSIDQHFEDMEDESPVDMKEWLDS
tara:strand:+ start:287 stop:478 length:192 start_codon:yes stop_codon:yes gene_type:complete